MNTVTLLQGDCLQKLKELKDNSIDSVVTDPPYEIGFMGKGWDDSGIANNPELWKEVLRVLKPGGHLLSFSHSRTYHRQAVAVEDAGFEIRDQILWIYGSGFPKSHDVGKNIEKIKVGGKANLTQVGTKKGLVATNHNDKAKTSNPSGFSYRTNQKGYSEVATDRTQVNGEIPVYEITNDYEGWGTALKPAHEPIVMARKPFKGTVAGNVLEWGTGGINIDGCRIGTEQTITKSTRSHNEDKIYGKFNGGEDKINEGRFPANIIFDEEAGKILDEQSGISKGKKPQTRIKGGRAIHEGGWKKDVEGFWPGDNGGGASRFFYKPDNNDINDKIWEQQLNVSIAQKSLYQQEQVEDFVASLVAIRDNPEDKQLRNMILPFMNEMQIVLKNTTEKGIKKMILLGEKFLQELQLIITEKLRENPVKYVEIQKLINITMIIQNLLSIDGFVEHIISNTILSSMVLGEVDYQTRFKYCPKASKKDRNEGCDELEEKVSTQQFMGGMDNIMHSDGSIRKNAPILNRNSHPTVKPTDLMAYLIRLVTPKGGTVLDPFMGSGSTGKASVREGFNFVGIEREEEYMQIAKSRIEWEQGKHNHRKFFDE